MFIPQLLRAKSLALNRIVCAFGISYFPSCERRDAAVRHVMQQLVRSSTRFVNFDNVSHSLFKSRRARFSSALEKKKKKKRYSISTSPVTCSYRTEKKGHNGADLCATVPRAWEGMCLRICRRLNGGGKTHVAKD